MIFWQQRDGNNVNISGVDKYGFPKIPVYNMKMGYKNGALISDSYSELRVISGPIGAQADIFLP